MNVWMEGQARMLRLRDQIGPDSKLLSDAMEAAYGKLVSVQMDTEREMRTFEKTLH